MPLDVPRQKAGPVYWLTGLAGAGKTTLARLLTASLRESGETVVMLDGDVLREVFGGQAGHTRPERLVLATQYGALCDLLSRQGVTVVCATISMFHQVRHWNREHIARYCEIYLKVPLEVLVERDQKGLYQGALNGEIADVIGVNAPFEEPESPDIMLTNAGDRPPQDVCAELLSRLETWSTT